MSVTEVELEAHYLCYISCLNDRRLEGLDEFVHDELTYNGEPETRGDYRTRIAKDVAAIPDLYFDVHLTPDRRRRRPDRVSAVLQLHAAERVARPAVQRQIDLVRGARLLQVPRRQDLRSVVPARRAIHREAAGLSADAAAWVRRRHLRPTVGDQEKSCSIAEEVREAPIAIRLGRVVA
jgi:hypothetical protein